LTVVDFKVERGLTNSEVEYHGNGVKAVQDELDAYYMMLLSSQANGTGARMGENMSYFGPESGYYFGDPISGSGEGYYF
jgi:hypothetical protein